MIEIDEGIGRPDCFAQVVARDDLTCVLQERGEDLKRLFLQPDASPVLAQLSSGQVGFKNAKSQKRGFAVGGRVGRRHRHLGAPVVYREAVVSR